jgi:hypothetical protein
MRSCFLVLHFATLFFLTIVIFIYSSLLTPSSIKSTIWWTTLYVIFTASSLIHHIYTSIAAIVATLLLWSLARHIQVMQGSFLCCYGGFNHSLLAVSIHRHSNSLAAIAATTFTLHHVEPVIHQASVFPSFHRQYGIRPKSLRPYANLFSNWQRVLPLRFTICTSAI